MLQIESKLRIYYITAIFSVVFAAVGFSYNAWRLELSEENNNIRIASFQVLNELAELEQIIYAAYYDKNKIEGSPRKGWVKVGLIKDLSVLIDVSVETKAGNLFVLWEASWQTISSDQQAVDLLVIDIDKVRQQVKKILYGLE